jgi:hypothetical protein
MKWRRRVLGDFTSFHRRKRRSDKRNRQFFRLPVSFDPPDSREIDRFHGPHVSFLCFPPSPQRSRSLFWVPPQNTAWLYVFCIPSTCHVISHEHNWPSAEIFSYSVSRGHGASIGVKILCPSRFNFAHVSFLSKSYRYVYFLSVSIGSTVPE